MNEAVGWYAAPGCAERPGSSGAARNSAALSFGRAWYLGYIPPQRENDYTSGILDDAALASVFDGQITIKQQ